MAAVAQYTEYNGMYYIFTTAAISFGSDVAFVMPPHGDFSCPCNACRLANGVHTVERTYQVRLEKIVNGKPNCPASDEFQKTMDSAIGVIRITIPVVTEAWCFS